MDQVTPLALLVEHVNFQRHKTNNDDAQVFPFLADCFFFEMSWRFCTRIYARCPRSTETPLISPTNCLYPVHSSGEASKFYLYNWKFQRWCGPWSLCIWISLNEFLVHDSCTLYVLLMEVHDLVSFFLKNQAITPSLKMGNYPNMASPWTRLMALIPDRKLQICNTK